MTGERRSPRRGTEGGRDERASESSSSARIPHRPASVNAERIAEALACGRPGCGCGKRQGKGWLTHCPAHVDASPSLSVTGGDDGKVLLHCHAGCSQENVIDALRERGLWHRDDHQQAGLSLVELAQAKGLPVDFLRGLGVRDGFAGRYHEPCVDIPYCDDKGEVKAIHKRIRLTGEPRFIWRKGDKVLPYGLVRLHDARSSGRLLLVEGDSDCWTLWYAGMPALGVPGASTWRADWIRYLRGIEAVFVWREPDAGGDTLAAKVALDFPDIRIIEPVGVAKDASDLYLQDRAAFAGRVRELMDRARPASELRAEALGKEAREVFQMARPLLEDRGLLDRIAEAIEAGGYAGDARPPLLAYIALMSRLLERPLNLAFIAPSAAGKNRAVDAALALMPPSAYHEEKAGSARALVYGETDFQHKTVVVAEADSIPEDGPAASAVRALAADNSMSYDVTERDGETGRFAVRHIEKPGPTGLITTSIKPLGEQMGTRLLAVAVADTPEQTRAVLAAHASTVNGPQPTCETAGLVALQRWLELAGDRGVTIPYAHALAQAVPADLVRMRRDFRQLLTVIQAVALLYQRQRERDADGRIIASLEDYAHARYLLLDVFTEAATGGVSHSVRETVQALTALYDGTNPVTITTLAGALRLHRATIWRRVQAALYLDFMVNTETRKGQPAKLVPGAPLPEERLALPLPEDMWGSPYHPETDATVQPDAASHIWPLSSETVAEPVAQAPPVAQPQPPMQPPLQPPTEPVSDTKTAPEGPPVAVLRADRDEVDTPTPTPADADLPWPDKANESVPDAEDVIPPEFTGKRHLVVALGAELGFPNVTWKRGGIPAGRYYYEQAARFFSDADIEKAVGVLEGMKPNA